MLTSFPEIALDLIETKRVYGLCGSDGCPCAHFSVHHCNVDIACHKSGDGPLVRVHSNSIYYSRRDLEKIADEVVRQVASDFGRDPYPVSFVSYTEDRKTKEPQK